EVVHHDIEPAVPKKIRDGGSSRTPYGLPAGNPLGENLAVGWGFDSQLRGLILERAIPLVHHQAVRPIVEGIAHTGRNEHVDQPVVVEVSFGNSPGPESLHPSLVGYLGELASAVIPVQGVAEQDLPIARPHSRDQVSL